MSETSRRVILHRLVAATAVSAVGVKATARAAPATPDPIFATIERHRLAEVEYSRCYGLTDEVLAEQEGRKVTDADEAVLDAAGEVSEVALDEMLNTAATTAAGLRAFLEYAAKLHWDVHADCIAAALASPILEGPMSDSHVVKAIDSIDSAIALLQCAAWAAHRG